LTPSGAKTGSNAEWGQDVLAGDAGNQWAPAWQRETPDPCGGDWRGELKDAIRSGKELCERLAIRRSRHSDEATAERDFPVLAPPFFVSKMRRGDPRDPLFLQVAAAAEETLDVPGFSRDPVGEADLAGAPENGVHPAPALLKKYAGRALLMPTAACAVHCRYCFRRHYPYGERGVNTAGVAAALDAIAADQTIREVILSGGDPLTLADTSLEELAGQIARIPHVTRLRVHTRLPVVIPSRVTDGLLAALTATRLTPIMVVHANHPREICETVAAAIGRIVGAGVPTLNQSVLLKGINDDADTLTELCQRLVNAKAMPYYLHQLDRVAGAAHFEVEEARGRGLIEQLRTRLAGYAVPRYVREVVGKGSKIPVGERPRSQAGYEQL